jgi:hypothetical protein
MTVNFEAPSKGCICVSHHSGPRLLTESCLARMVTIVKTIHNKHANAIGWSHSWPFVCARRESAEFIWTFHRHCKHPDSAVHILGMGRDGSMELKLVFILGFAL